MAPYLEQSAGNVTAKGAGTTCTATFSTPTRPGSLIVVVAVYTGDTPTNMPDPSGYTWIGNRSAANLFGGGIQMSAWYRQDAPATSQVTVVSPSNRRAIQLRVLEYSGMAQANVLDKVVGNSSDWLGIFDSGTSGTTAQADELVLAFVSNEYSSTQQFGFGGGLTQLYNTTSPSSGADWERSRLTVHQAIATSVGNFRHTGFLSTVRRWCSLVITFRGGSSGPARFTSKTAASDALVTGGTGSLTVFGKLSSLNSTEALVTGSAQAKIGPYNYQYRLGGWDGLLIGADTSYPIESIDGLEGWEMRTSDDDLPRGDGALRGVDLQASRQVLFKLNMAGTHAEIEERLRVLYNALGPQRDESWDLIWRHAGQPLKLMRVRPVTLMRQVSQLQMILQDQSFALLAADPRHYSAFVRKATIPVAADRTVAVPLTVINFGNSAAYPTIRIEGPLTGPPVTRVELVNESADVSFVVEAVLPAGSTLVGDMEARATGANRSVVTIDGQSKYGAWQHPRTTWRLGPGGNELYVLTNPPGRPVKATIEFRDTWAG